VDRVFQPDGKKVYLNKTSFDLFRDFSPVSQIAAAPYVLTVHPQLPAKSVSEFAAYAKANPGTLKGCAPSR